MPTVPTPAPLVLVLTALVDDAALFPPANAALPAALTAHTAHRAAAYGLIVGTFLCPASRLTELSGALPADARLTLGVILDTGLAGLAPALGAVARDARLTLAAVEGALPRDRDPASATEYAAGLAAVPAEATAYVELPLVPGWQTALDQLAETPCAAKLRTGGSTADAVPSPTEVAAFVRACVDRQLAFKCTAGLHSAVRGRHDGVERHGFLNLLAATAAALDGAEGDELAELLDSRDGSALVTRLGALGEPEAEVTREFFRSFGSCSIDEPVADLRALGVLP